MAQSGHERSNFLVGHPCFGRPFIRAVFANNALNFALFRATNVGNFAEMLAWAELGNRRSILLSYGVTRLISVSWHAR
jgi:hypothetical protein